MKLLIYLSFLLLPRFCQADTFILKDGARLEGEVTGEMDGTVLVKTRYGSLTINKTDIREQLPVLSAAAPAAASPGSPAALPGSLPEAVAASTAPAAELSTALPGGTAPSAAAPEIAISTAQQEAASGPAPRLTFQTILPSTITRQLVYMDTGVAVATETFDAGGALVRAEGAIADGTYTESYPDGGLKTVKNMIGGKANGTLKAFFPSGALQIEAYYLSGGKEGPFKYYTEDGKLLMEVSYKNDLLNGWRKEYGPDGGVSSETYYLDGRLSDPRGTQAAPGPAAGLEPASMVAAKIVLLARGERISFHLNGKYVGNIQLDRSFNIINQDGKVPDGAARVYGTEGKFSRSFGIKAAGTETFVWSGKLARELLFEKNILKRLRIFDIDGGVESEYTFEDGKAVKK